MPFYAVGKGRTTGIFTTWTECQESVKGFSGAMFKKFDTKGDAEGFIHSHKGCHKGLVSPDYYVFKLFLLFKLKATSYYINLVFVITKAKIQFL
jgi:ribonuclease HI